MKNLLRAGAVALGLAFACLLDGRAVAQTAACASYDSAGTCVPGAVLWDPIARTPYKASGGGTGGSTTVTATAAPPTYAEGSTTNPLSTNLSADLRTIAKQSGTWNVGISGTLPAFASTPTFNIGTAPTIAVTGTFWQATQPVSAAALPLPSNAAQETGGNLAAVAANTAASQATTGATAATKPTLAGAKDPNGNQQPNQQDVSGNLQVANRGSIFWNGACASGCDVTSPLTGSGGATPTFTGLSRDSGYAKGTYHQFSYFSAFFLTDQAATAYIDCSNDNFVSSNYVCATGTVTAGTPLILQVPVLTRYHRARLTNTSATAETYLNVNSGYTAG
jgi:hypothetical protein